ncbi:MAG: polysaccharide deacetylase family protein [Bacteroidota bacterium]
MLKSVYRNFKIKQYLRHNSPIILYHQIYPKPVSSGSIGHVVELDKFEQQIDQITKRHKILFVDELFERLEKGEPMKGLASITFDDGMTSVFDYALPFLEERNIPTTVFLNSNYVNGGIFWRNLVAMIIKENLEEDFVSFAGVVCRNISPNNFYKDSKNTEKVNQIDLLEAMKEFLNKIRGNDIVDKGAASLNVLRRWATPLVQYGNHTANHFIMAGLSFNDQLKEILEVAEFLKNNFARENISNTFAIPFGDDGSYNDDTIRALKKCGYNRILPSQSADYLRGKIPNSERQGLFFYNRFMPRQDTRFY